MHASAGSIDNVIDGHTHVLRLQYDDPAPWPDGKVGDYHRQMAARGLAPFDDQVPIAAPDDLQDRLRRTLDELASKGIVEIHEMMVQAPSLLPALQRLADQQALPVRVHLFLHDSLLDDTHRAATDDAAGLQVAGIKLYADGWLGERTAAVTTGYPDTGGHPTDDRGVLFLTADDIARRGQAAADAGLAIATHAIGDRAVDAVLDGYDRLWGNDCATVAPRIEHASLLRDDQIARIVDMGVVASIQWSFATSDAPVLATLPDHLLLAYRWQALVDAGARIITGSDHPVETLDPTQGFTDLTTGAIVGDDTIGQVPVDVAGGLMRGRHSGRVDPGDPAEPARPQ